MKVAVSACLLGDDCKYNGGNNFSEKVAEFVKGQEVIPICPEVMGGLSTPREPSEIVNGIVKHRDGSSVDAEFRKGARLALKKVIDSGAELVILQSRSPSCGASSIYDGTFSGTLIQGQGVFAKLLTENNIKVLDVSEL
ncbi:MAG: DUF523 domain-containing protein [Lachnospiraceae bacterium]|nr:DUF523 domain-containing protein [Lachnospiraceae bacterium]